MNGAEYIMKFLENKGVDVIFGYPGGSVIFLYDVLGKSPIKHILTRHEQGAAHAADGYARVTGRPGVCFATSGPGATNLVTGLANAYLDSVPILAITGQAAVSSIGRDSFQEADIVGITMPITKHNYLVKAIEELPAVLEEAWSVTLNGRPGPVLVDIPKDIFMAQVDPSLEPKFYSTRKIPRKNGLEEQINKVVQVLRTAERPMLFVGGGIRLSKAFSELAEFVEQTDIPVATSLMGKGVLPETHKNSLGVVGMHGKPASNLALNACDVLIALGVRFSDRVTGNPDNFLTETRIIHVDIDPAELSKNVKVEVPVACDAKKFLAELSKKLQAEKVTFSLKKWQETISDWKKEYPMTYVKGVGLKPQYVIEEVARQAGDRVVVTDVGQHQIFAAQYYPVGEKGNFLTSGGLGTMGYGLPAAMGASFGRPDEPIILFVGDGGIQMTIQELGAIAEYQLPVKIFIMNNSCLGMVRQWQELFFKGHYVHTLLKGNPDFVALAGAYGIKAYRAVDEQQIGEVIQEALSFQGPVLIDCLVDQGENVLPIIPPGGKLSEMLGRWKGEAHISRIG